ncbi:MAG: CpaD family pilus assembly lipoprotein [Dongiaceae bacterium]
MIRPYLLLSLMVLLSACSMSGAPTVTLPKTFQITESGDSYVITFLPESASLTDEERQSLEVFLDRVNPNSGDELAVSFAPAGGDLALSRSRNVIAYLQQLGFTTHVVGLPAGLADDDVAVTHRHPEASVAGCPDWSKYPGPETKNTPSSNFGCADKMNLGAMAANPRDLVKGQNLSAGDGNANVLAIQRYRAGKITPLLEDGPTKKN